MIDDGDHMILTEPEVEELIGLLAARPSTHFGPAQVAREIADLIRTWYLTA